MSDVILCAIIAAWWSISVVFFVALIPERPKPMDAVALAVFWPVFAPLSLAVILWRIPFRTARTIRMDLRNRKLIREFDNWLKDRDQ